MFAIDGSQLPTPTAEALGLKLTPAVEALGLNSTPTAEALGL